MDHAREDGRCSGRLVRKAPGQFRIRYISLASALTHSFDTGRRLLPGLAGTSVLFEDGIGLGGPLEWLRLGVARGDPGFDRCHQIRNTLEHAPPDALACDFRKQALDEIDPGR